jgi:tRNA uridine 5-carboxymethylaminomethyl modification enzyme
MMVQEGDEEVVGFSYKNVESIIKADPSKQRNCWITYTSQEVHDILKTGFDKSPMFQGRIQGTGPRYCPSIEDKINRFADKDSHQLFVEPEGWNTVEIYVNGFSTSLPEEVQYNAITKVPGFENCKFFRPGYAIEYDYFPPTQLKFTLETKLVRNLFFAGQINGTTGYEEAACQGLIAGINASRNAHELEPFSLQRNEAYIGVLIDDLINKGTDEPYRMFTSRAEFRTLLRQDNADVRLTQKGFDLGLAKQDRLDAVNVKNDHVAQIRQILAEMPIEPSEINTFLEENGQTALKERQKVAKLALRPDISIELLAAHLPQLQENLKPFTKQEIEQAEILLKYGIYMEKEKEMAEKMRYMEELIIPDQFNYEKVQAISTEARQKLTRIRPHTLGQASRISGVNPSDIQILMVHMGR